MSLLLKCFGIKRKLWTSPFCVPSQMQPLLWRTAHHRVLLWHSFPNDFCGCWCQAVWRSDYWLNYAARTHSICVNGLPAEYAHKPLQQIEMPNVSLPKDENIAAAKFCGCLPLGGRQPCCDVLLLSISRGQKKQGGLDWSSATESC